jgi:rare lipoprotein A
MAGEERRMPSIRVRLVAAGAFAGVAVCLTPLRQAAAGDTTPAAVLAQPGAVEEARKLDQLPPVTPPNHVKVDPSGRKEEGKASIYSKSFDGKKMADGERYSPHAEVAASKSLPLGTVAKVTNLDNGKSVEVKVEDRGPFVKDRVVDLTPNAASKLGLTEKQGVAPVMVAPIVVPQPGGGAKAGAGAAELPAMAPPAEREADADQHE